MTNDEAGQQLRSMMEAMYEGRSVRTPEEFKRDLRALRVAADILDPPTPEVTSTPTRTPSAGACEVHEVAV